jgi:hypothetical protein
VSGDDGGDDSEDVDEADKGVDDGLLVSIYLRGGEGRGSVQEEGGIPLGQADSQALVQMSDLASADPSFLICSTALSCQPPRVSATRGVNTIPSNLQASWLASAGQLLGKLCDQKQLYSHASISPPITYTWKN